MNKKIIKDTAEYNYNLGYLKALDDVEKVMEEHDDYAENLYHYIKDKLKELRGK